MPTQQQKAAQAEGKAPAEAQEGQAATLTQEDVDKAVAAAVAKVESEFEAKVAEANRQLLEQVEELAAQQEATGTRSAGSSDSSGSTAGLEEYEYLLDTPYHRIETAPGKPTIIHEYVKGDKIPLDPERAKEFIRDRVVADPDGESTPAKRGAQTSAPGSD